MKIEWFEKGQKAPTIGIAKYGVLIKSGAHRVLGYPTHVKLGYDRANKVVAIQSCQPSEHSFEVKVRNGMARINTKDFVKLLELDLQGGKTSDFIGHMEDDMLIVKL